MQASNKGGVRAFVAGEGPSPAPFFRFHDITRAVAFYQDLSRHVDFFKDHAEKTSRFACLTSVTPRLIGSVVHAKFDYFCGDAAGHNMATIATHAARMAFLALHGDALAIIDFAIEGSFSSDKKLSLGSVPEPRGVAVHTWSVLTDQAARSVFKVTTKRIHQYILVAIDGTVRNGQQGVNANASNIIAAMFIACGQDAASVLESGWSQLVSEYDEKTGDLTLSSFFPPLVIGTVGGGSGYPTQKEALELLNCYGDGKKWALAETIARLALALELSTCAALANDTSSAGDQKLARL